ncbi:hypothetical protein AGMMS49531_10980 [Endomicrobiia bacterium]|nr:hypothetical protein AGMMS49531_10980 [Endomicrobiia bacterium]
MHDLNLTECATLAAIPKSPNHYNPFKNPKASLARRNLVLLRMRELGYITKEQEKEAAKVPVPANSPSPKTEKGHYFVEFLKIMLEPKYGTNMLMKGGLSIYTTLDSQAQIAAEKTIEEALAKFDKDKLNTHFSLTYLLNFCLKPLLICPQKQTSLNGLLSKKFKITCVL